MGEFDIIADIRRIAEKSGKKFAGISLGIGDDCCILETKSNEELALSIDTIVEQIHFRLDYFSYYQVGVKAAAAAISDLAAMAADPAGALASVSISDQAENKAITDLALGLIETCSKYGCPLIGGDLTGTAGPLVVTVTVIGRLPAGSAVRRSTARAGDEIWVTGTPGDAGAVLALYERARAGGGPLPQGLEGQAARLHEPVPRLAEARALRQAGIPTAMIDISDGVAADLNHILEDSGVGAILDRKNLPITEFSRSVAIEKELQPEHYFLYGGEDYELLFTAPQGTLNKESGKFTEKSGTTFSKIGKIIDQTGKLLLMESDGILTDLDKTGFDHFRKSVPLSQRSNHE